MGPAGQQDVFSRYRTARRAVKAPPATAADLAAIGISVVEFDSTKES